MRGHWIIFSAFGLLAAIILAFFAIRLQPIKPPQAREDERPLPGSLVSPSITYVDPMRGAPEGDVTIVTFSDFACSHCATLDSAIARLLEADTHLKHVWKDMPNEGGNALSTPAALAAECAAREGRFWEFHDKLFAQQDFLSDEFLRLLAQEIGLDAERFGACLGNRETLPLVRRDYEEGIALGVEATPTFYVNNVQHVGVISDAELASYVAEARRTL